MNIKEKIIELFQKHLLFEVNIRNRTIHSPKIAESISISFYDYDVYICQYNKKYVLTINEFLEENITFDDFRLNLLVRDLQKELKNYFINH